MSNISDKLKAALWTNGLGDWPGLNEDLVKKLIACVEALDKIRDYVGDHAQVLAEEALAELEKELDKGT